MVQENIILPTAIVPVIDLNTPSSSSRAPEKNVTAPKVLRKILPAHSDRVLFLAWQAQGHLKGRARVEAALVHLGEDPALAEQALLSRQNSAVSTPGRNLNFSRSDGVVEAAGKKLLSLAPIPEDSTVIVNESNDTQDRSSKTIKTDNDPNKSMVTPGRTRNIAPIFFRSKAGGGMPASIKKEAERKQMEVAVGEPVGDENVRPRSENISTKPVLARQ